MPQCASVGTKMAAAAEAADPAAAMSAVAACRASVTLSFAVGRRHFMRAPLLPLLLLVLMSASTGLRQVAARRAARYVCCASRFGCAHGCMYSPTTSILKHPGTPSYA
eukprot:358084-Chlamydomonas_euryale.AAC.4